jgi:hypothetical protein
LLQQGIGTGPDYANIDGVHHDDRNQQREQLENEFGRHLLFHGRILILLQGDIAVFSESGSGWAPGTFRRQGHAIVCGLCLVLDHLLSSEHGNITLKEY